MKEKYISVISVKSERYRKVDAKDCKFYLIPFDYVGISKVVVADI